MWSNQVPCVGPCGTQWCQLEEDQEEGSQKEYVQVEAGCHQKDQVGLLVAERWEQQRQLVCDPFDVQPRQKQPEGNDKIGSSHSADQNSNFQTGWEVVLPVHP